MANTSAVLERPESQIDGKRIEKILMKSSEKVRRNLLKGLHEEFKADGDAMITGQEKVKYKDFADEKLNKLAEELKIADQDALKKMAHKILWKELLDDKEKNTLVNITTLQQETSKKVKKLLKKSLRLKKESETDEEKKQPALRKNAELIVEQVKADKSIQRELYYQLSQLLDKKGKYKAPDSTLQTAQKVDKILYRLSRKKGLKKAVWELMNKEGSDTEPKELKNKARVIESKTKPRVRKASKTPKPEEKAAPKGEQPKPSEPVKTPPAGPKKSTKISPQSPSSQPEAGTPPKNVEKLESTQEKKETEEMIKKIRDIKIEHSDSEGAPKKPEAKKEEPSSWWGNITQGLGDLKDAVFGEEKEKLPSAPEAATAIIQQIDTDHEGLDAREVKAHLLVIIQDFLDGKASLQKIQERSKKKDLKGAACIIIVNVLSTKYEKTSKHVLRLIEAELATKGKGGKPLPVSKKKKIKISPPQAEKTEISMGNKPKDQQQSRITVEPAPKKKKNKAKKATVTIDAKYKVRTSESKAKKKPSKGVGVREATSLGSLADITRGEVQKRQSDAKVEQEMIRQKKKIQEALGEAQESMELGSNSDELPNTDEERNKEATEGVNGASPTPFESNRKRKAYDEALLWHDVGDTLHPSELISMGIKKDDPDWKYPVIVQINGQKYISVIGRYGDLKIVERTGIDRPQVRYEEIYILAEDLSSTDIKKQTQDVLNQRIRRNKKANEDYIPEEEKEAFSEPEKGVTMDEYRRAVKEDEKKYRKDQEVVGTLEGEIGKPEGYLMPQIKEKKAQVEGALPAAKKLKAAEGFLMPQKKKREPLVTVLETKNLEKSGKRLRWKDINASLPQKSSIKNMKSFSAKAKHLVNKCEGSFKSVFSDALRKQEKDNHTSRMKNVHDQLVELQTLMKNTHHDEKSSLEPYLKQYFEVITAVASQMKENTTLLATLGKIRDLIQDWNSSTSNKEHSQSISSVAEGHVKEMGERMKREEEFSGVLKELQKSRSTFEKKLKAVVRPVLDNQLEVKKTERASRLENEVGGQITSEQRKKDLTVEDAEGYTASDREILKEFEEEQAKMRKAALEGKPMEKATAIKMLKFLPKGRALVLNTEEHGKVKLGKNQEGQIVLFEGSMVGVNKNKPYDTKQFEKVAGKLSKVSLVGGTDTEAYMEEVKAEEAPEQRAEIEQKEDIALPEAEESDELTEDDLKMIREVDGPVEKAREGEPLTKEGAEMLVTSLGKNNAFILNTEKHGKVKFAKTEEGNIKLVEGSMVGVNKYQPYPVEKFKYVASKIAKENLVGKIDTQKYQEQILDVQDREYIPDWKQEEQIKTGEKFRVKGIEFIDGQLAQFEQLSDGKKIQVRVFKSPARDAVILKPEGKKQQFAIWSREALKRIDLVEKVDNSETIVEKKISKKSSQQQKKVG